LASWRRNLRIGIWKRARSSKTTALWSTSDKTRCLHYHFISAIFVFVPFFAF
jgi:hypothetical protein